jgi:hypothetical protein
MLAVAAGVGILGVPAGEAQPGQPAGPQAEVSWHHRMLYRIMKDMTAEMDRMTEQMSGGDLPADQRKQMGERMQRMATLMGRMSGLAAQAAMADPESQKQMEEMRREMDAMMRDARMTPGAK